MVGLDDLRGLFQPMILWSLFSTSPAILGDLAGPGDDDSPPGLTLPRRVRMPAEGHGGCPGTGGSGGLALRSSELLSGRTPAVLPESWPAATAPILPPDATFEADVVSSAAVNGITFRAGLKHETLPQATPPCRSTTRHPVSAAPLPRKAHAGGRCVMLNQKQQKNHFFSKPFLHWRVLSPSTHWGSRRPQVSPSPTPDWGKGSWKPTSSGIKPRPEAFYTLPPCFARRTSSSSSQQPGKLKMSPEK